jgi:hypothetical protein
MNDFSFVDPVAAICSENVNLHLNKQLKPKSQPWTRDFKFRKSENQDPEKIGKSINTLRGYLTMNLRAVVLGSPLAIQK